MTLPAFAADRRAVAPCCGAVAAERRRLLSIDGTDRRTEGRTLVRFIDPAPHAMGVATIKTITSDTLKLRSTSGLA